jgi:hypothetical protein
MAVRYMRGRTGGCLLGRRIVGMVLAVGCRSLSSHFFGHTITIPCSPKHCPYRTLVISILDFFSGAQC